MPTHRIDVVTDVGDVGGIVPREVKADRPAWPDRVVRLTDGCHQLGNQLNTQRDVLL
jgi:hypothetical protein